MKTKFNKGNLGAVILSIFVILLVLTQSITTSAISKLLEENSRWKSYYVAPDWFNILWDFNDFITEISSAILPIMIIAIIIFFIVGNFKNRKFESRWGIFVTCIFYGLLLLNLKEFEPLIENELYFSIIQTIISSIGFLLLIVALLRKNLWNLSIFGLGTLTISSILRIVAIFLDIDGFNDLIMPVEIIATIALLANTLLLILKTPKLNHILRNISILLIILATLINIIEGTSDNIICVIAFIAFTYLLVPTKFKIDSLKKIVSILFLILAASTMPLLLEAFENEAYIAITQLSCGILGLLALFISLILKAPKKITVSGLVLLALAIAINIVAHRGSYLNAIMLSLENVSSFIKFNIITADVFNLIAVILLIGIACNTNIHKIKARIAVIVVSVLSGYLSINEELSVLYLLYLATLITLSIVLVPIKFTINNNIGKHLFLCVFTFGIWYLVWLYNVTKYLNTIETKQCRVPLKELLLSIFIPFYVVYWYYKTAEIIQKHLEKKGVQTETPIISLVFALIAPLIASVINQNRINEIVTE